ncbi:MAG TPA: hypothetical protein VLT81_10170, partial [Chondromyces sp.]|nr:hypothetical protein [Chondromyces sp.]
SDALPDPRYQSFPKGQVRPNLAFTLGAPHRGGARLIASGLQKVECRWLCGRQNADWLKHAAIVVPPHPFLGCERQRLESA